MHRESRRDMRRALARHVNLTKKNIVLDVGSYDVNGTYKCLIPENNVYIGTDIAIGPNVDFVMSEFSIPLKDKSIDIVLCGQVLEHCRNPFKLIEEAYRIVKPGGHVFLVAPFIWPEHRFPLDCFRYLPDGMSSVLEFSGFKVKQAYLSGPDCWGVGTK